MSNTDLKDVLEPDFRLLEAYIAYSGELSRLACLVLAFLILLVTPLEGKGILLKSPTPPQTFLVSVAICSCSIAVVLGLLHRWMSLDGMHFFVQHCRKVGPDLGQKELPEVCRDLWKYCDLWLTIAFGSVVLGSLSTGCLSLTFLGLQPKLTLIVIVVFVAIIALVCWAAHTYRRAHRLGPSAGQALRR